MALLEEASFDLEMDDIPLGLDPPSERLAPVSSLSPRYVCTVED